LRPSKAPLSTSTVQPLCLVHGPDEKRGFSGRRVGLFDDVTDSSSRVTTTKARETYARGFDGSAALARGRSARQARLSIARPPQTPAPKENRPSRTTGGLAVSLMDDGLFECDRHWGGDRRMAKFPAHTEHEVMRGHSAEVTLPRSNPAYELVPSKAVTVPLFASPRSV